MSTLKLPNIHQHRSHSPTETTTLSKTQKTTRITKSTINDKIPSLPKSIEENKTKALEEKSTKYKQPSNSRKIGFKKTILEKINHHERVLEQFYLPDDICCEIMKYLDGMFVIKSCFLISSQWYRVATTDHCMSFSTIEVGGIDQVEELMKKPWISRVHGIDLYEECGDDTISMIRSLSNLSKLVIPKNCLTSVGYETLSNNFNLTELDVRGSTICQNGFENICKQINLTRLNISACKLKDLKSLTQLENLTCLKFDSDLITVRSDLNIIENLKNLKVLNLRGMKEMIGLKLSSLNHLTKLNLSSCRICLEDIQEITMLSNIVKLNVDSNWIGDSGAQILKNLKSLKSLDVCSNSIEIEGVKSICGMKQLTCLNIGKNNIGSKGLDLIVKNLKNLTELDIRVCNIGMGVRAITELPKLTSLDIRYNNIGSGIDIISSMKSLRKLQVCDNFQDREAKCLSEMKNLTFLNVGYNYITSKGVVHISKMKNLTELNIECNSFGLKGAQSLTSMSNLTNLSISFRENLLEKGKEILAKKKFSKLCILEDFRTG